MWKVAKLTPISKGNGSRDDKNNYSPISVLPILSKVFDKHHGLESRSFEPAYRSAVSPLNSGLHVKSNMVGRKRSLAVDYVQLNSLSSVVLFETGREKRKTGQFQLVSRKYRKAEINFRSNLTKFLCQSYTRMNQNHKQKGKVRFRRNSLNFRRQVQHKLHFKGGVLQITCRESILISFISNTEYFPLSDRQLIGI